MEYKPLFDHEKLEVYQLSLAFIAWCEPIMADIPRTHAARDNLDRASTSIPLNTAEGNGRYTEHDRCRFFDIARGSALECAACLDTLVARERLTADVAYEGKVMLARIVSMLVGLIKSNSAMRVHEPTATYG
jgi:four helix bundle protein